MDVIVSHSGKQHSYHLANALRLLNRLEKFYTSSYITSFWLQDYFQKTNNTYWSRRFIPGLGGNLVDANWRFEVKEVLMRQFLGKSKTVQEAVYQRDTTFDSYVAKKLKKEKGRIFWGFQGSCRESLLSAASMEKITICELATAHVTGAQHILGEEARLQPDWADSMDNLEFPAAYEKRLKEEPHSADFVIAASEFTKQTLLADNVSIEKIIKIPLGFDISHINFQQKEIDLEKRPLRLLYAGTVTQRKGVSYLLDAMEILGKSSDVELHMIGGIQGSGKAFQARKHLVNYHPPISQLELFQAYAKYDVLVLPTIFEGFGLVLVEAMAAGLPVITTSNSFGPELITTGKDGFIVPIRNPKSLADAIGYFRKMDNGTFAKTRTHARLAAEKFTWELYRKNLDSVIQSMF